MPAGDDLDWHALEHSEALCLTEKRTRVFLAGEGGTGKTYVVGTLILNAAYRFFLGKFCDAKPLAFTHRAARLYGPDARTVMGYLGIRPENTAGRRSGGGAGAHAGCGPLLGSAREPGVRAAREQRMRATECYTIDELSQVDGAYFDTANLDIHRARAPRDRMRCDALGGHTVHPFGMVRSVALSGDFAQLHFPNSDPLCTWPRWFCMLPVPRFSSRQMEDLVGTGGRRKAKNDLHVDRLRERNGFAPHERIPDWVPNADTDLRTLFCGDRDPFRWLLPGGGAEPGRRQNPAIPTKRRHAYEAYIRCSRDVVEFPHTQRFRDDDGEYRVLGKRIPRLSSRCHELGDETA